MRKTIDFKRFSIDLTSDWSAIFRPKYFNWIDFNLIGLRVEKEKIHGSAEIEIHLLGFGVRVYWTWDKEMLEARIKEYEKRLKRAKWKVFK